jgi:hypothetical protein
MFGWREVDNAPPENDDQLHNPPSARSVRRSIRIAAPRWTILDAECIRD